VGVEPGGVDRRRAEREADAGLVADVSVLVTDLRLRDPERFRAGVDVLGLTGST
jgi:hypothetical protein